jgi:hypothetical protein
MWLIIAVIGIWDHRAGLIALAAYAALAFIGR